MSKTFPWFLLSQLNCTIALDSHLIKTVLLCLPIHLEMSETNSNNLDIGHSKEESGASGQGRVVQFGV